jgi:hypothetical protein
MKVKSQLHRDETVRRDENSIRDGSTITTFLPFILYFRDSLQYNSIQMSNELLKRGLEAAAA